MGKQRVERTRNLGTMTDAQYWGSLRSALRKWSLYWRPIAEAKKRQRVSRGVYMCEICHGSFGTKEVQVDHKIPCGSLRSLEDLAGFIERLTPEDVNAFQLLCKPCHRAKGQRDAEQ